VRAAKDEFQARACGVARGSQTCGWFFLSIERTRAIPSAAQPLSRHRFCVLLLPAWFRMKKI
jgi:hypothetical protein